MLEPPICKITGKYEASESSSELSSEAGDDAALLRECVRGGLMDSSVGCCCLITTRLFESLAVNASGGVVRQSSGV